MRCWTVLTFITLTTFSFENTWGKLWTEFVLSSTLTLHWLIKNDKWTYIVKINLKWRFLHAACCQIHISMLYFLSLYPIQKPENTTLHIFHYVFHFSLHITHLTPGGRVPVQTWLKVTGHLGSWPGGYGPAVERTQGSLIPHVKTLDLSWFNATLTILGALERRCGRNDCYSNSMICWSL